MKVKLLLIEDLEKNLKEELEKEISSLKEESDYQRVLNEINGIETDKNENIFIDLSKYYKETDFYFKKSDVSGIFLSHRKTVKNQKIMIIIINNEEYDCLYNENVFTELINFLNN